MRVAVWAAACAYKLTHVWLLKYFISNARGLRLVLTSHYLLHNPVNFGSEVSPVLTPVPMMMDSLRYDPLMCNEDTGSSNIPHHPQVARARKCRIACLVLTAVVVLFFFTGVFGFMTGEYIRQRRLGFDWFCKTPLLRSTILPLAKIGLSSS